ncbi:MAG: hypothetical protein MPN21_22695 [Thermoanaerobaculia bacterium]|nr:hypothetical protein [Thermoanaerobaculia bacterium]
MTVLGWTVGSVLGAGTALILIAFVRRSGPLAERRFWALALLVAALVYVGFAALGVGTGLVVEPSNVLGFEGLGVMVYGALGALGTRHPRVLAAGWVLHVIWDLGHRHVGWVPDWYVVACVAFDVVVASYLGLSLRRGRAIRPKLV